MLQIEWADEAVANLDAIVDYISAFNPAAARRLAERLIAVADSLVEFPERGRRVDDSRREITVVQPYVLRYRVDERSVMILRIRHSAQLPD